MSYNQMRTRLENYRILSGLPLLVRSISLNCQCFLMIVRAACAVFARQHSVVVEQTRKLIGAHQFNNEPLRILLASLASGLHSTDSFITSTLQKHIFREIKIADTAVHNKEGMKWNALAKRYVPVLGATSKAADEEDGGADGEGDDDVPDDMGSVNGQEKEKHNAVAPDMPKKDNPIIVALYGQICIAAKSYQSAIC
jgi:general transcription factor 3C polypeptide 3 (transcription factor C subunit 4)